jgi:RluA family pseudouridine synthase
MSFDSTDLEIPLLLETEDFFLFNKLAGIIVQQAKDNPSSLSRHLEFLKKERKDNSDFFYTHVHRLDKDTSGALLVAKTQEALSELNKVFRERAIRKKYLALCVGIFKEKKGELKLKLKRAEQQGAKEKVLVSKTEEGKETHSSYTVLEEYYLDSCELSLVEVELHTGFMHQIRVHMKDLGHPILGDSMYGNSFLNKEFSKILQRQFLHAHSLEFEYKGENHKEKVPLTEDLEFFLKKLVKDPSCVKESLVMS